MKLAGPVAEQLNFTPPEEKLRRPQRLKARGPGKDFMSHQFCRGFHGNVSSLASGTERLIEKTNLLRL
uniref:Uncharacterized protein n=1 Tax=Sphaerodactylus townsendi TaxID=933632 RepID=A0ACB8ELI5_9SAUR